MEQTIEKKALNTQQNLLDYFQTHDVKYVAEDAVFREMGSGKVYSGREEISGMLHFLYHVAFDAKAEVKNYIITEDRAHVDGYFVGKHIGEIEGIPPTFKDVRVPLSVSYSLENGLIKEARVFFLTEVLLQQLGITGGGPKQKTTYIVRDIFQLKFGQFKEARKLLDEAMEKRMMPEAAQTRVLTDFTGPSYRLIFEEGFDNLADYEISLTSSMKTPEWQEWYKRFTPLVDRSYREILKQFG